MNDFFQAIGIILLLLIVMAGCDPKGFGKMGGDIVAGYKEAFNAQPNQ